jgi:hypothetical protein
MPSQEPISGAPVTTALGETSMCSAPHSQDIALAFPIVPNVGVVVGQDSTQGSSPHVCHKCAANYREKKGLNRHFRDKHLPPKICGLCRRFEWPGGRIGLFKRHLHEKHLIKFPSRSFLQLATISPEVPNDAESLLPLSFPPSLQPPHSRKLRPAI